MPEVNVLNANVGDLEVKIEAAKGNPQLLASLQAQVAAAKYQADRASKELLLAIAPGIASDLHWLGLRWDNESASVDEFISSASEKRQRRLSVDQKYSELSQSSLPTADTFRREFLQQMPVTEQTPEERSEAVVFAKSVAGQSMSSREVMDAGSYLLGLSHRVAANSRPTTPQWARLKASNPSTPIPSNANDEGSGTALTLTWPPGKVDSDGFAWEMKNPPISPGSGWGLKSS
jgi:hypothetical protein